MALCGVIGGLVSRYGGWSNLTLPWKPVVITRVVWRTNYTDEVKAPRDAWSEPLRPIEQRIEVPPDSIRTVDIWTNSIMVTNATSTLKWIVFPTNLFFYTNMVMYVTNNYRMHDF